MGLISIIINVCILVIISVMFYLLYKKKNVETKTWIDSYIGLSPSEEEEEQEVTSTGPVYGNIGNFTGQDWSDVPCAESLFGAGLSSIPIDEEQDDISEFMDKGKPEYVGTGRTVT